MMVRRGGWTETELRAGCRGGVDGVFVGMETVAPVTARTAAHGGTTKEQRRSDAPTLSLLRSVFVFCLSFTVQVGRWKEALQDGGYSNSSAGYGSGGLGGCYGWRQQPCMVVAGWSSCMRGLRLLLAWRVTEAWVMMGGGV
ncbi:bifunctional 3-5 exonuclease/DNA-polymerase [Sesbania bispinosa]|nr:bifunctional 3-5 exonuclease/DNA-polymerase [Sesbania bispinosa]